MNVPELANLARYTSWADATLWAAVLPAGPSREDARLRATLHHLHLVQHLFVQAWLGEPLSIRDASAFISLDDLAVWACEAHQRAAGFLTSTAAGPDPDRPFREPWTDRYESRTGTGAGPHTLGESFLQVVLHSSHHRGQLCTRLRELGVEPPTIDFVVWLWAGKPEPDWSAVTGRRREPA
ncbi:MAG: DinB family protein [Vicinamibacterales bacterium]